MDLGLSFAKARIGKVKAIAKKFRRIGAARQYDFRYWES
jgi:hypothetical protein